MTIGQFFATGNTLQSFYPIENKGWSLANGVPYSKREPVMIIFALTFAILALFALSLTGSIATATRRRS